MRGLEKKLHPMAQTDGHGDSMTNSAQWGRVGEKLTLCVELNWSKLDPKPLCIVDVMGDILMS